MANFKSTEMRFLDSIFDMGDGWPQAETGQKPPLIQVEQDGVD
ncbi:hypothetical protein [Pseudomonas sp. C11]|nr:hypothetical protein [Pseudomonas sp. C11]